MKKTSQEFVVVDSNGFLGRIGACLAARDFVAETLKGCKKRSLKEIYEGKTRRPAWMSDCDLGSWMKWLVARAYEDQSLSCGFNADSTVRSQHPWQNVVDALSKNHRVVFLEKTGKFSVPVITRNWYDVSAGMKLDAFAGTNGFKSWHANAGLDEFKRVLTRAAFVDEKTLDRYEKSGELREAFPSERIREMIREKTGVQIRTRS